MFTRHSKFNEEKEFITAPLMFFSSDETNTGFLLVAQNLT